jgi:competence protein ComEC
VKKRAIAVIAILLAMSCLGFACGGQSEVRDETSDSSDSLSASVTFNSAENTSNSSNISTQSDAEAEADSVSNAVASEETADSASSAVISTDEVAIDSTLKVRFIDVGQGDCVLVSADGHNMLIDGGKSKQSSKVYSILRDLGITYLDYVVASHPDADHIGATSGALQYASIGTFYCSTATSDTKTFAKLVSRVEAMDKTVTIPANGDSFTLGSAVCTFVNPGVDLGSDNNDSLVLRLDYGQTSFLFTGDAESEEESAMLRSGANLDVDVLKVAHHGSSSSSTAAFLRAVSPTYAVISVGDNSYGHPTSKTLNALATAGAQALRTDELGTITFYSDGVNLTYTSTAGNVSD